MATAQGELSAALHNTQTATTLPTALRRTSELEHETKRLSEQLGGLRKKYERAKQAGGGVDDVLEEELSEMKKMFTCGACNQRQKVCTNMVLTWHFDMALRTCLRVCWRVSTCLNMSELV
jgi:hypothetical protein